MKLITSWDEATFDTYKAICEATLITNPQEKVREFIKILAIENKEVADLFGAAELEAFDGLISWINNLDTIVPATTKETLDINIAEEPWEKLVVCHQAIEKHKDNLILGAQQIVAAYLPDFDFTCSFSRLIGAYLVLTEKVYQFHEKFKSLSDANYKSEELKAGVKDFAQFGFFGTLNALCKGDVTLYESMLKQKAGVVYNTLVLDKFRTEYQQRLQDQQKK